MLLEPQSKKPTVISCIGETNWKYVLLQIETARQRARNVILVHRGNILPATFLRSRSGHIQCFANLPFVNTIEQMAIVDEKTGPKASF